MSLLPAPAPAPPGARVVDLTLLLAEELPCSWSTHVPFQQKTYNYFADDLRDEAVLRTHTGPYQTRWLLIDEHTGTHVDAPAHFVPPEGSGLEGAGPAGAVTVEQIDLARLMGPAVVVDVPADLPGGARRASARRSPRTCCAPSRTSTARSPPTTWCCCAAAGTSGTTGPASPGTTTAATPWCAAPRRAGPPRTWVPWSCSSTAACGAWAPTGSAWARCTTAPRCTASPWPGAWPSSRRWANLGALPVRGAFFCFAPLRLARGTGAPGRAFAWVTDAATRVG